MHMNRRVVSYVQRSLSEGRTERDVFDKLKGIGLSDGEITEALDAVRDGDAGQASKVSLPEAAVRIVRDPRGLVEEVGPDGSVKAGMATVAVIAAALSLPMTFFIALGGAPPAALAIFFAFAAVALPVASVVGSLVLSAVLFGFIKIFRGECRFEELYYLVAAVFSPPYLLVSLGVQPAVSLVFAWVALSFGMPAAYYLGLAIGYLPYLFPLYLLTIIVRFAGRLNWVQSFLCWFIPAFILAGASVSMYLMLTQAAGLNPARMGELSKSTGFGELKPAGLSFFGSGEPDRAAFTLVFSGVDGTLDGSSLRISKSGSQCKVGGMMMRGVDLSPSAEAAGEEGSGFMGIAPAGTFLEQNLDKVRQVRMKKGNLFYLTGEARGPGCGGAKGGEYIYQVSYNVTVDGQTREEGGAVMGRYLGENAELDLEVGYSTSGKTVRWNIRGL
jgi:hypothetical protein